MGILFTILMGFLFTITIGKLFTITVGIQLAISTSEGFREYVLTAAAIVWEKMLALMQMASTFYTSSLICIRAS